METLLKTSLLCENRFWFRTRVSASGISFLMSEELVRVHLLPVHPGVYHDSSVTLNYKTAGPPSEGEYLRPLCPDERQKQARYLQTILMDLVIRHSDCVVYASEEGFCIWIAADVVPSLIGGCANSSTTVYFEGPEVRHCKYVELLHSPAIRREIISEQSSCSSTPWYKGIWRSLSLNFGSPTEHDGFNEDESSYLLDLQEEIRHVLDRVEKKVKKKSIAAMPGTFLRYGTGQFLLVGKVISETEEIKNEAEEVISRVGPGLVTRSTEISVKIDESGYFSKVHISAFDDTIPRSYNVNLFEDYLRPYLYSNGLKMFGESDIFEIQAVQFKVLATEPASTPIITSIFDAQASTTSILAAPFLVDEFPAGGYRFDNMAGRKRIGPLTQIYFGAPILPQWMDILDADQQAAVRFLPSHLQTFAIIRFIGESHPHDIERVMNTLNIVNSGNSGRNEPDPTYAKSLVDKLRAESVGKVPAESVGDEASEHCSVCLYAINVTDLVVLPCKHKFHYDCILHWFMRTPTCPLCKQLFESS